MDVRLLRQILGLLDSGLPKMRSFLDSWSGEQEAASPEEKLIQIGKELSRSGGDLGDLESRLAELEREWDEDQALQIFAGITGLLGAGMAARGRRSGMGLAALAAFLLFQNSSQRRSHLSESLRSLGIRSRSEIEQERYALKALRGDFAQLPTDEEAEPEEIAHAAWRAASKR